MTAFDRAKDSDVEQAAGQSAVKAQQGVAATPAELAAQLAEAEAQNVKDSSRTKAAGNS